MSSLLNNAHDYFTIHRTWSESHQYDWQCMTVYDCVCHLVSFTVVQMVKQIISKRQYWYGSKTLACLVSQCAIDLTILLSFWNDTSFLLVTGGILIRIGLTVTLAHMHTTHTLTQVSPLQHKVLSIRTKTSCHKCLFSTETGPLWTLYYMLYLPLTPMDTILHVILTFNPHGHYTTPYINL